MADVKISELPALTSPDGAEELVVNDGGTTKKITIANATSASLAKAGGTMTGVIAGFESTGIDDNATATKLTVSDTGIDVTGTVTSTLANITNAGAVDALTKYSNSNVSAGWSLGAASGGDFKLVQNGVANRIEVNSSGTVLNGRLFVRNGSASNGDQDLDLRNSATESSIRTSRAGGTSKPLSFWTSSNHQRMIIDATGNVGIGVVPETWNTAWDVLQFGNAGVLAGRTDSANGIDVGSNFWFEAGASSFKRIVADKASRYNSFNGTHVFQVAATGAADSAISWTDAMTINNAGKVGILTAPSSTASLNLTTPDAASWGIVIQDSAANGAAIKFLNQGGSSVGNISTSGSSTSYNTSSDYRLKTNVLPMTGATATFMQLKPCNFVWKVDGTRTDGFLAHELGAVIPAAATGTHNGMVDEEYEVSAATGDIYTAGTEAGYNQVSPEVVGGPAYYDINGAQIRAEIIAESAVHEAFDAVAEVIHSSDVEQPETLEEGQAWRETTPQVMATRSVPDYQGIDQSKVVPLLVATLQELVARIEALEA